ncbi:hypothetical protein B5S28_g4547 [[Candida] boidinii]|nr:hypothetical protein B5S28_g4547 [[Candida] boidinii]OWB63908.1 hypothetical protein B5S29_g4923 [[Candida] boidinii]
MDQQFLSELENTLLLVQKPDSNIIKQATESLKKNFYPNPLALPSLIHILTNSQDAGLKQLAAVEAKKLVSTQWEDTDVALQDSIRESLIKFAYTYESEKIRHSTARIISAIADLDVANDKWPTLLQTLVGGASDSNQQVREMSVFILFCILELTPVAWFSHIGDFLNLFSNTLQDSSVKVQVCSISALDAISAFIEEDDNLSGFAPQFCALFPQMISILKNVLASNDSENTKELFNSFNSFILLDSKLVGSNLTEIIKFMTETALNANVDEEIRVYALHALLNCISYRKSKISQAKLGPILATSALRIACEEDAEAEDKLEVEDEENENEEDQPDTIALRLLANLAAELPASQSVQPVLELVPQLLGSANQFERRAALSAIGVVSEGAPDYISTQLPKIIKYIEAGLQDPSILVKASALRSLGYLSSELKDGIAEYHETLLPTIIAIIDSTDKIMVYKFATIALDTLIEYMSNESIKQYMEPLMNKLFQMLDAAASSSLRSSIVSAIGSVAYASGKAFLPFFENSIKFLERFIANMDNIEGMSEDDIELRAQTFENISSMGRAVGSEAFAPYAEALMQASYSAINSDNSRLRESGFAFIANMAKVYGEQFSGFLDKVMPEIFKCISQSEFEYDNEDEDIEDDEDALAEKLKIHTGITYEKEVALVALQELAVGTKDSFSKFIEPTMTALAEQFESSYSIRDASLQAMWKVVNSMFKVHGADNATVLELIKSVRKLTVESLPDEFDFNTVMTALDCFYENVKSMGKIAIMDGNDSTLLESLCTQLMLLLKKEHPCQIDADDEDADEEDADASEMDAALYDSVLEVLVSLSGAFGGEFIKIFTGFKDIIVAAASSKSKNKRVSTLGCLAEICNGIKGENPFTQELLETFVKRLSSDKSTEVRGNAAYGVGILIQFATIDVTSAYPTILAALSVLLNKADKEITKTEDGDDETKDVINRTFANACGCVCRMTLKHQASVPLEAIVPTLLEHLPLQSAFEENTPIFELILKLYEQNNEVVLKETPKFADIFEAVFKKELEKEKLINESTLGREENIERLNQFETDELKIKVIAFLQYLEGKFPSVVSSKPILKSVIA